MATRLSATACLYCWLASTGMAQAQGYPERPVRVIVGSAAGGNADILARIVSQRMGQKLGQQFVVDNRAGAAGLIGAEIAAKAQPDGYTFMHVASNYAISPALHSKLPFDPVKDLAPIGLVSVTPLVLTVTNSLAAGSVKELVAIARARPGELSFVSAGTGSPGHMAGVLFNGANRITMVHVPYKATAQAMTDLATGQVHVMFPTLTAVLPQINAGRLRGLAITSRERSGLAPAMPTVHESGIPGYEASIWNGWVAPARTPQAIVAKVQENLVQTIQSPEVRERFTAIGADPVTSTPAAFGRLIADEIAKWSRVVREAGVRVE